MQSSKVVIVNEGGDLLLHFSRKIVIVQQDSVFHRLMPALNLPLRLGMIGREPDMFDFSFIQPIGQIG